MPKPKKKDRTAEDILAALAKEFDTVEREMRKPDRHALAYALNLRYPNTSMGPALQKARERVDTLIDELREVLHPGPEIPDYDDDRTLTTISERFAAAPGQVPTWTQAGTFVMWLGYVPIGCRWTGFADLEAAFFAIDPAPPWLAFEVRNFEPTESEGFAEVLSPWSVDPGVEDVADLMLRRLTALAASKQQMLVLKPLSDEARAAATARLGEPGFAWVPDVLRRGPDRPVALPKHLQAVQQGLF